jgi:XTP/dITP diphosphohydrolase
MKPRLVIASNNRGKLREYAELLEGCGFELVTPGDLGFDFNPAETGSTYEENALIKAREAARLTGIVSLADDSGIEVDALGGRPGLFSARYAGGSRTSDSIGESEQLVLLLGEMQGVPDSHRTARFVCVIAIVGPDGVERTTRAEWPGHIAHEARGEQGFGYDPVFIVPDFGGRTSAELAPDVKNRISHRGQASAQAREILRDLRGEIG